ncbi:lipoyl(octanoyl) transferase [bacterium]|jgi:lipoyl(octanoyl) transferase|nr:lipoyl(octanoyl) transferase [bacterium]NBW57021.1 lipoyl(octanoyl) transferase [bacterium]NBX72121.1 lipoyl(octanoyl) transferase [bacterium]
MQNKWKIWDFGYQSFSDIEPCMRQLVNQGDREYIPTLWFGEHYLVVTKGLSGYLDEPFYPFVPCYETNRGGKLTLHLPGQLVFYPIFKLPAGLNVKQYVHLLEQVVINTLVEIGISSFRMEGAPGIYTIAGKISSIGIRVSQQYCYHGISLNVSCPLRPFSWLISCGNPHLKITSIADHHFYPSICSVKKMMQENFFKLIDKE